MMRRNACINLVMGQDLHERVLNCMVASHVGMISDIDFFKYLKRHPMELDGKGDRSDTDCFWKGCGETIEKVGYECTIRAGDEASYRL